MPRGSRHIWVAILLAVASIATIATIARAGWPYYRLSIGERVRSPLHATWKPGGTVGRRLGIVGTGLMLANLAYMVRRRARFMQGVGTPRAWLEVHVFCGLTGPAILVFHSAFLTQNLVARVTAASTALVVSAGILGRYFYAQLPRDIAGKERALADLVVERRALAADLVRALPPGEEETARGALEEAAPAAAAGLGAAPGLVLHAVAGDVRRLLDSFRLARRLRAEGLDAEAAARAARLAREIAGLRLRIAHMGAFQRILAIWREVHVKLAAVMVACVVIHVGVVWTLGYAFW